MTRLSCEVWTRGHHLETVELDRERIVIGAADACDVTVAVDGIANEHALIKLERGDVVVGAWGSARVVHNGRVVEPLQRPPLWSGDVIELGTVQIIVEIEPPPAPAGVQVRLPARQRASAPPPLHAMLLVAAEQFAAAHSKAVADALFAYLVAECDARVAPWALSNIVDRGEAPADDVARALCRSLARHHMLGSLLPRIASHGGWSKLAAWAYTELPPSLRTSIEPAMLGHASWDVRLFAATSLRDLAERERALRAVRRSFVASGFSSPHPTHAARPSRRIDVERGPDLPSLRTDHAGDITGPRVPLVLDATERTLVAEACEVELAAAMSLVRALSGRVRLAGD